MNALLWLGLGAAGIGAYAVSKKKKSEVSETLAKGAGVYQLVVTYPTNLTSTQVDKLRAAWNAAPAVPGTSLINMQAVGNRLQIDISTTQTPAIAPHAQPFTLAGMNGTLISVNKIA